MALTELQSTLYSIPQVVVSACVEQSEKSHHIRVYVSPDCEFIMNRDQNAAISILLLGVKVSARC